MPPSRPMPSVGPGVEELRIRDRSGIYRAFYYTKSARVF
jgi:phage-related protein